MSLVFSPVGLAPQGYAGYGPYEGGSIAYQLTTNNTVPLARGDVVGLVGGSVVPLTADATPGTLNANTILGVITGFSYYVPAGQQVPFQTAQFLPANSVTAGYTAIFVNVVLASSEAIFSVCANGPVTSAQVGGGITLAGYGAADVTFRKTSTMYANASTINQAGGTQAWKIVAIDHVLNNAQAFGASIANIPGDLYTQILIRAVGAATIFGSVGGQ